MYVSETIPDNVKIKLEKLVSYLCQVRDGLENVAGDIECKNLRSALYTLAEEAKQYAQEISNQFTNFNFNTKADAGNSFWNMIATKINEEAKNEKGGEIYALCNNCETYFTTLYEDILQECLALKHFKSIIAYQLYATKCAFMKIRLLNSMRLTAQ